MIFQTLSFKFFRCFTAYQTDVDARFNYIVGENGAGKTAFLEAVSLLCTAHSFRVREVAPLIQTQQSELTLVAHLTGGQTIGINKTLDSTSIKINGQSCFRTSELAALLPSQIIYQDIFQIIDAGPVIRRQLLDWGVFHVKPSYHDWWCQYKQGLKQRNSLLKKHARESELHYWNITLNELALKMDQARREYINLLNPIFKSMMDSLTEISCDLIYYNGWDRQETGRELIEVLKENYQSDLVRQYTQFGPHHADLEISTSNGKAKQFLSRGQQKILLLALKLAQAKYLNKHCVYLWDDICSELDQHHLGKLGALLESIPGQFFISGIEAGASVLARTNPGAVMELKLEASWNNAHELSEP